MRRTPSKIVPLVGSIVAALLGCEVPRSPLGGASNAAQADCIEAHLPIQQVGLRDPLSLDSLCVLLSTALRGLDTAWVVRSRLGESTRDAISSIDINERVSTVIDNRGTMDTLTQWLVSVRYKPEGRSALVSINASTGLVDGVGINDRLLDAP